VRREFLESMIGVAATGRTVFLSSHQISEIERVADTIAILHKGKVQLVGPLADLKESIAMVTVSLSDPLIALADLPEPSCILAEISQGRQKQMIVRGDGQAAAAYWKEGSGVLAAQSRAASLEELFVACTRGDSIYKRTSGQGEDSAQARNSSTIEASRS
jgi:ABC-2 type transport system ATP-binding protein